MSTSEIFIYLFIYVSSLRMRFSVVSFRCFEDYCLMWIKLIRCLQAKPTIDWLSLRGKYLALKGCKIIILKKFHRFKLGPKQPQSHGIDLASTSLQTILSERSSGWQSLRRSMFLGGPCQENFLYSL